MDTKTLPQPEQRTTTEPQPGYVLRGHGLFELHRGEVLRGYQGAGKWLIPSGSESGRLYEVRVGIRPERNRCECVGFEHHRHCSHVVCATIVGKKSAVCDCCGERRWWSQLTEVTEDHESLTWFPGDLLCYSCLHDHGGIA